MVRGAAGAGRGARREKRGVDDYRGAERGGAAGQIMREKDVIRRALVARACGAPRRRHLDQSRHFSSEQHKSGDSRAQKRDAVDRGARMPGRMFESGIRISSARRVSLRGEHRLQASLSQSKGRLLAIRWHKSLMFI